MPVPSELCARRLCCEFRVVKNEYLSTTRQGCLLQDVGHQRCVAFPAIGAASWNEGLIQGTGERETQALHLEVSCRGPQRVGDEAHRRDDVVPIRRTRHPDEEARQLAEVPLEDTLGSRA